MRIHGVDGFKLLLVSKYHFFSSDAGRKLLSPMVMLAFSKTLILQEQVWTFDFMLFLSSKCDLHDSFLTFIREGSRCFNQKISKVHSSLLLTILSVTWQTFSRLTSLGWLFCVTVLLGRQLLSSVVHVEHYRVLWKFSSTFNTSPKKAFPTCCHIQSSSTNVPSPESILLSCPKIQNQNFW